MAAISACISASVFSGAGAHAVGSAFSCSNPSEEADLALDLDSGGDCEIWTCFGHNKHVVSNGSWPNAVTQGLDTYIKLPALDVFPGVLVCNDNDQLGYLAANHPFI
jgi:hypothetical protein